MADIKITNYLTDSQTNKILKYTCGTIDGTTNALELYNSNNVLILSVNSYGVISFAQLKQIHTTGATVTVDYTKSELIVNPSTTLATLTITMPLTANLRDGQEFKIGFGGTLKTGSIVTILSIVGNTSQTILTGSTITSAQAGDGYILKWDSTTTCWHIY